MIKRIIFDLDDTIINWKSEYDEMINKTLEELNFPHEEDLWEKINNAELEYELQPNLKNFNKQELTKYINKKIKIELPNMFLDVWISNLGKCVPKELEKEDYEIFEYLSKKYELVILTNWFEKSQRERLERVDILKYFKEVYGGEKYLKPHKESFLQAMGNRSPEECAMIGDNLKIDIEGAKNAKINKIIWKDNKNKKDLIMENLYGVEIIHELKELKNIF